MLPNDDPRVLRGRARQRQKVLARVKVEVVNVRTNGLVLCWIVLAPCPLLDSYCSLLDVSLPYPIAFISLTVHSIFCMLYTHIHILFRTKCETSKVRSGRTSVTETLNRVVRLGKACRAWNEGANAQVQYTRPDGHQHPSDGASDLDCTYKTMVGIYLRMSTETRWAGMATDA
jgi:hypothetical protein